MPWRYKKVNYLHLFIAQIYLTNNQNVVYIYKSKCQYYNTNRDSLNAASIKLPPLNKVLRSTELLTVRLIKKLSALYAIRREPNNRRNFGIKSKEMPRSLDQKTKALTTKNRFHFWIPRLALWQVGHPVGTSVDCSSEYSWTCAVLPTTKDAGIWSRQFIGSHV
jgi:hypothetical protein